MVNKELARVSSFTLTEFAAWIQSLACSLRPDVHDDDSREKCDEGMRLQQ